MTNEKNRRSSNASPACSQCTVEPATHCARCVAAAEVHARRMGQLDQIGKQVETIGRAIDSRGEQRTGAAHVEEMALACGRAYDRGRADERATGSGSHDGVTSPAEVVIRPSEYDSLLKVVDRARDVLLCARNTDFADAGVPSRILLDLRDAIHALPQRPSEETPDADL